MRVGRPPPLHQMTSLATACISDIATWPYARSGCPFPYVKRIEGLEQDVAIVRKSSGITSHLPIHRQVADLRCKVVPETRCVRHDRREGLFVL